MAGIEKAWDYGRGLPPDLWPGADGKQQSPIDIPLGAVSDGDTAELELAYAVPVRLRGSFFFESLHLEVKAADPKNAGGVRLAGTEGLFLLHQFHFHTPSEHWIDGQGYEMEIHLVHEHETSKQLLVTALLVAAGGENEPLQQIIRHFPDIRVPELRTMGLDERKVTDAVEPQKLYPGDLTSLRYTGSLTTPPCTKGISFVVLEKPIEASTQQIQKFARYVPSGNNRPIQPRDGRPIYRHRG
jgi:carbonic anhydrase